MKLTPLDQKAAGRRNETLLVRKQNIFPVDNYRGDTRYYRRTKHFDVPLPRGFNRFWGWLARR